MYFNTMSIGSVNIQIKTKNDTHNKKRFTLTETEMEQNIYVQIDRIAADRVDQTKKMEKTAWNISELVS